MPLDTRIPLAFEPVKFERLSDVMGNRARLANARQEMQLRQQQIDLNREALEQRNKQQKEDAADEQLIQQEFVRHSGDFDAVRKALVPKLRTRNLQRLDNDHATALENVSKMDKQKWEKIDQTNKVIGSSLTSIALLPPEQRQAAWAAEVARLKPTGVLENMQIPDQVPDQAGLESMLGRFNASVNYLGILNTRAQEQLRKATAAKDREAAEKQDALNAAALIDRERSSFYQTLVSSGDEMADGEYIRLRQSLSPKASEGIPRTLSNSETGRTAQRTREMIRRGLLSPVQAGQEDGRAVDRNVSALDAEIIKARAEDPDADEGTVMETALSSMLERQKALKRTSGARAPGSSQKDDRGYTTKQVADDIDEHEKLQSQEHEQWRLAEQYDAILKGEPEALVTDPGSRGSKARPLADVSEEFTRRRDEAMAKARDLMSRKDTLRKKHGWDTPARTQPSAGDPGGLRDKKKDPIGVR